MLQQKSTSVETEKLRRLRLAAETQEAKLNEIRNIRESIQEKRLVLITFCLQWLCLIENHF